MRLIWARPQVCLIADQQPRGAVNLIQNRRSGDLRLIPVQVVPYQITSLSGAPPVDNWTRGPAVLKIIPRSLFNINSLFMLETLTCALDNLRILEGKVNTENNGKHRSLLVTNSLIK